MVRFTLATIVLICMSKSNCESELNVFDNNTFKLEFY